MKRQSQAHIRIKRSVKESSIDLARSKGISLSALVEMSLHRTVQIELSGRGQKKSNSSPATTRIIPDEVVRSMITDHQNGGLSYRKIATKYGYALRTCHRAVNRLGSYAWVRHHTSPGRPAKLTAAQQGEIIELATKGLPKSVLAYRYRVSVRTIQKVISGR